MTNTPPPPQPLRGLTLTQPWAGLVATGVKRIENRVWQARNMVGQRFAIHASRQIDHRVVDSLRSEGIPYHELWNVRSAIVAVATLHTVIDKASQIPPLVEAGILPPDQERWFFGPLGFVLTNIVELETPRILCSGARSFWELPKDVLAKVEARLACLRGIL